VLFRRLLHTFLEQRLELGTDLLGLAFEFVQELALVVVDLAVGKEHPAQSSGFLGVDPAMRQNVVFDGLGEEALEGWRHVLLAFVQLDEEVA
jgi:hypothetical protein